MARIRRVAFATAKASSADPREATPDTGQYPFTVTDCGGKEPLRSELLGALKTVPQVSAFVHLPLRKDVEHHVLTFIKRFDVN